MPTDKKNLQSSARKDRAPVKPAPPADLWAEMERVHEESKVQVAERPKGFTTLEYATKYGLSIPGANHRLRRLVRAGKIVGEWAHVNGWRCRVYRPKK